MVYVIGIDGRPLMPTNNAKARKLLKQKKAKVVKKYLLQLNYFTKLHNIHKT